jgi:chromosome segregation ATPase
MARNMAIYGLRHKRNRLAGQVEVLRHRNQKTQVRIGTLLERIDSNNQLIAALKSQIDSLAHTAEVAFETSLGVSVPRKTVPKQQHVDWC